jgi:hypothetical protein
LWELYFHLSEILEHKYLICRFVWIVHGIFIITNGRNKVKKSARYVELSEHSRLYVSSSTSVCKFQHNYVTAWTLGSSSNASEVCLECHRRWWCVEKLFDRGVVSPFHIYPTYNVWSKKYQCVILVVYQSYHVKIVINGVYLYMIL